MTSTSIYVRQCQCRNIRKMHGNLLFNSRVMTTRNIKKNKNSFSSASLDAQQKAAMRRLFEKVVCNCSLVLTHQKHPRKIWKFSCDGNWVIAFVCVVLNLNNDRHFGTWAVHAEPAQLVNENAYAEIQRKQISRIANWFWVVGDGGDKLKPL